MFNIKKVLAVVSCLTVCACSFAACSDKDDKNDGDAFSISEVSGNPAPENNGNGVINSNPDAAGREFETIEGNLAQEYDYYGLKYTVNEVSELYFDQIPDGKVIIVNLSITNDSEYEYKVGALANFDVRVDGEGETASLISAQVMTLTSRYYANQGIDMEIFGTERTPAIQPGETFTGYLPIALTSDIVDFETITISFLPDAESGVYSSINVEITPDDIKTAQ